MLSAVLLLVLHVSAIVFEANHLAGLHRVEPAAISPNGQMVVFTASQYNVETGTTRKTLYLKHLGNSSLPVMPLVMDVGSQPLFLSNSIIAVLCTTSSGLTQLCYSRLRRGKKLNFKLLFAFPYSITTAKFNTNAGILAFTAAVPSSATNRASGVVYDKLFVRHWDVYIDPGMKSHLFFTRLVINNNHVTVDGAIVDVMQHTQLETPVAPYGDNNDYDIADSGNWIAFSARVGKVWETNTDIFLVPISSTANSVISAPYAISASNKGYDNRPVFYGTFVYWLQMNTPQYEADLNRITWYDLRSTTTGHVASGWDRSPESIAFLSNKTIVTNAQDEGRLKIFTIDIGTGTVTERVGKHSSSQLTVFRDGVLCLVSSMVSPNALVVLDTETWTPASIDDLNEKTMADFDMSVPEEIWFKGAKNESVHGWVMKPVNYDASKSYGLAYLIHGGPEGAWNDDWSYRWNPQVFANAGFFVAFINFHGSTGYGLGFTRSILKNWGTHPFQDIIAGLNHVLKSNPQIDPTRVAALGASYGGYMINYLNGKTKDTFACLVNHDGIFDLKAMYFSTEELWFPEYEFNGTPFDAEASKLYHDFSPSRFADSWQTPTLVVHGEKDYRIGISEGLSTFTALQRRGVPSKLLYFPDENHWVTKPANSIQWYVEVLDWITFWTLRKSSVFNVQGPQMQML